ncbi:acyl-CoA N-acyltransferase [Mycotypha africana]|uniref:acyl-CoA N-acyltransferase n=1 Tax=Mycotypha africana TaxID=64632 RepID=UPI0023010CDF|nr:acyl-CoA N-acyltransferase [Mycotypha africana]KAI8973576.1 acyl-CoA N-acyltransferase [Mycotypha africana]
MEVEVAPHPAAAKVVDFEDWACNSNECTEISLVHLQRGDNDSKQPIISTGFNPDFTYSVFGAAETIFGYKNLSIKIKYTSGSLKPYVEINYTDKYKAQTPSSSTKAEVEADDINAILGELLPKERIDNYHQFIDAVKRDYTTFRPLGDKVQEYTKENNDGSIDHFEIYKCSFADKDMRRYYSRIKLFVLLFVEGSSFIDDEDDNWEIYTTYKREDVNNTYAYHFIGYCAAYPFWCWPENIRMRISQFLILSPFKKQGHGSKLYQTIYQLVRAKQDICEMAVEDPNDEFSDMRDKNDLRFFLKCDAFKGLKAPVPENKINELHAKYKLTNRQTQRALEMYLLSKLNKLNHVEYKTYRLQVKKRLYLVNYDVLQEIEEEERKEKLEQTYLSIEEDYHRLLELV